MYVFVLDLRFGFTYGGSVIVRRARELLFVVDFFEEARRAFSSVPQRMRRRRRRRTRVRRQHSYCVSAITPY
tara:strand:+ start:479 stop:694 length:216 start_codon:yes stop_codon:yes gene_type:complete